MQKKELQKMVEEIVQVTPEIAEHWLTFNRSNRNVRKFVVEAYASDMLNGRWIYTGDAIRFDEDGTLIDGQHRLLAIIQSGMPQTMRVIRGLDSSAKKVIDTGARRMVSDVLQMQGITNSKQTAAAARMYVLMFEKGWSSRWTISNAEVLEWYEANPGISNWFKAAMAVNQELRASIPIVMAVMYRAERLGHDTERLHEFVESLVRGTMLSGTSPAYHLRRWFMRNKSRRGISVNTDVEAALVIKALNAYLKNRSLGMLRWPSGEEFPQLVEAK
jgi:hypothetical protein